jgi:hypothetical protein
MFSAIRPFSFELTRNSLWLEVGNFSLYLNRNSFHWTPDAWTEKGVSSVYADWLGLRFVGSRAC